MRAGAHVSPRGAARVSVEHSHAALRLERAQRRLDGLGGLLGALLAHRRRQLLHGGDGVAHGAHELRVAAGERLGAHAKRAAGARGARAARRKQRRGARRAQLLHAAGSGGQDGHGERGRSWPGEQREEGNVVPFAAARRAAARRPRPVRSVSGAAAELLRRRARARVRVGSSKLLAAVAACSCAAPPAAPLGLHARDARACCAARHGRRTAAPAGGAQRRAARARAASRRASPCRAGPAAARLRGRRG